MNGWNKLLVLLDSLFGFPNKAASKVKKVQQAFDNRTQEHVIWIEYRVRVNNAQPPTPDPKLVRASADRKMALMRELLAQADRPRSAA
jgi:hypothetical protein